MYAEFFYAVLFSSPPCLTPVVMTQTQAIKIENGRLLLRSLFRIKKAWRAGVLIVLSNKYGMQPAVEAGALGSVR